MKCLFPQESPFPEVRYLESPIFSGAGRKFLLVKKGDILNSNKRNFDPSLNTGLVLTKLSRSMLLSSIPDLKPHPNPHASFLPFNTMCNCRIHRYIVFSINTLVAIPIHPQIMLPRHCWLHTSSLGPEPQQSRWNRKIIFWFLIHVHVFLIHLVPRYQMSSNNRSPAFTTKLKTTRQSYPGSGKWYRYKVAFFSGEQKYWIPVYLWGANSYRMHTWLQSTEGGQKVPSSQKVQSFLSNIEERLLTDSVRKWTRWNGEKGYHWCTSSSQVSFTLFC